MAKAKGRGISVVIDGDYSNLHNKLNAAKAEAKSAGAAVASAFGGALDFSKTTRQIDVLASSMAKTKASVQALDADFKKAETQLNAVAKAAGISEKNFASLARQMAQKTNLDNLERSLDRIQRLTGASALQMAKLRHEAGDTIGAIRGLAQAAETSIGNLITLKNVIVAGIVGQGFREFSRITSLMTDLDARIRLATGSANEAAMAFSRIHEVANRTYASLESTAEIFLANATAFKDLGYSTKQQLDLMESLTNALVVSGAKGQRAETVINALAKSMMEGELKGRNWTTVLQQGGRVVQALADGLGVSIKQLKDMAAAGELTSEKVFKALTSQLQQLTAEAEAMPATLNDAFTRLGTNYKVVTKAIDDAKASSSQLVAAIVWLSDNLVEMAAKADVAFTALISSVRMFVNNIMAAVMSVRAFYVALKNFGDFSNTLKRELAAVGQTWKQIVQEMGDDYQQAGDRILVASNKAAKATDGVIDPAHDAADAYRDLAEAMKMISGTGAKLGQTLAGDLKVLQEFTKNARTAAEEAKQQAKNNAEIAYLNLQSRESALRGMGKFEEAAELNRELERQAKLLGEIERGETGLEKASRRRGGAAREAERAAKAEYKARQLIVDLEREHASLIGDTSEAQLKELEAQINKWQEMARKIEDATEQARAFALINEIAAIKAKQLGDDALSGLNRAMDDYIKSNTAAAKAADLFKTSTDAITNAFTDMITGAKSAGEAFGNMATTIVNQLARIAVEMLVMKPIVEALKQSMEGGSGGGIGSFFGNLFGSLFGSAKGNIFNSPGLDAYVNTVVDRPTIFPFARGGIGLMGEAGAEAIMPLERDSRGRLGVSVADGYDSSPDIRVVNSIQVINQTGTPAKAEMQSQRGPGGGVDTKIILKSIDEGQANQAKAGTSQFAQVMESNYMLNGAKAGYFR